MLKLKWTNIVFLSAVFSAVFLFNTASAHPGRTDSSGCHTCRTNCSSWGLSSGEYHCHNAKAATQPIEPIKSTYGANGTGYTQPAPDYKAEQAPSKAPATETQASKTGTQPESSIQEETDKNSTSDTSSNSSLTSPDKNKSDVAISASSAKTEDDDSFGSGVLLGALGVGGAAWYINKKNKQLK